MSNFYFPVNILTDRGVLDINDILPGDHVYEYKTGKLLKVLGIDKPTAIESRSLIRCIPYTDGRIEYIRENDYIFTGEKITKSISYEYQMNRFPIIKQYPIEFKKKVNPPLDPDPYLAGAFIIYGSFYDEYVNLPYYMTGVNDTFTYKHSIEQDGGIGLDGRIYFRYTGDSSGKKITWKQMFGDRITPLKVPEEYIFASVKDRIQFIRGVFDMGYTPKLFKDNRVGVVCNDKDKLITVQNILWSLGILSKVEYDDIIDPYYGNKYKLEIVDRHIGYPGFTHIIGHLEYLLDQDNKVVSYDPPFAVRIKEDHRHYCRNYEYTFGRLSNLILEKEQALYLSAQYLPRVSV